MTAWLGVSRSPDFVKDQACEEAWLFRIRSDGAIDPIFGEDRLNLVPQDLIDNWLMLSRVFIPLVCDLASIDAVLQHQKEGPAGKLLTTKGSAVCQYPPLAPNSRGIKFFLQHAHGSELSHIAGRYGRRCQLPPG